MKKLFIRLLILGVPYAGCVNASEYGCKVLMCLSNPSSNGGPKGVSECVPPINQLYDDLAHGRGFPTCGLADGNTGSSYARPVLNYFDPCPAGTIAAAPGKTVITGKVRTVIQGGKTYPSYELMSDAVVSEAKNTNDNENLPPSPQACVGNLIGNYTDGNADSGYTQYHVYDKVIWQPPQSPRAIDVYIDNKISQRVRW